MRKDVIRERVGELDGCRVVLRGQFESAGQVYYEIGVVADEPERVGEELELLTEGSDWEVTVYEDGVRPNWYDREADEYRESDVRVKKNLYNEHRV